MLTSFCLRRLAWARHLAAITEFFSEVLWCDSLAHCRELDQHRFGGSHLVMSRLLRRSFESLRQDGKFALAEPVADIAIRRDDERGLWEQLREECRARQPGDFDLRSGVIRPDDLLPPWEPNGEGWRPAGQGPAWGRPESKEIQLHLELGFYEEVLAIGQSRHMTAHRSPVPGNTSKPWRNPLDLRLEAGRLLGRLLEALEALAQISAQPGWTGGIVDRRREYWERTLPERTPEVLVTSADPGPASAWRRLLLHHPRVTQVELTDSGLAAFAFLRGSAGWNSGRATRDVSNGPLPGGPARPCGATRRPSSWAW